MLTPNFVNPVNPHLLVESIQPKTIYRLSIPGTTKKEADHDL
jgi:hypothetical protein